MDEFRATILLWEIGVAVVVQIVLLLVIWAAVRRVLDRVENVVEEVQQRALPTLDAAQKLITNNAPKVETIVDNLAATTTTVRDQVQRLDVTLNDIVDRTRLQVVRADEMLTRTMDKVEETTDRVQHTVLAPARQVAGITQGLGAMFSALFRRKGKVGVPQDEMFI